MEPLEINLNSNQSYSESSEKIKIIPEKKYRIKTEIQGINGEAFCGYFCIIILDKNEKEISRKIQWLNDFSGNKNELEIIFQAPANSKNILVCYRINVETPLKSECHCKVLSPEKIQVSQVDLKTPEDFDSPENYVLPKVRELTPEEEDTLEKNLVWIFASPRSGTSWLGTQLLSYQTLSVNEPLIGLHLGMRQPRFREKIIRHIDIFKIEPDYFFSQIYSNSWMRYLKKLILHRLFAQVKDLSKKIIIKEPNGSMGADILAKCMPNSKIILLLRDGRDVIDSVLDSLQKDSWVTKQYHITPLDIKKRFSDIKYQADLWVVVTQLLMDVFNKFPEQQRLLVRYEELRKNTKMELQKIYNFLKIDIPQNKLEEIVEKYSFENIPADKKGSGKVVRSATPGKWKESFSKKEQKVLNEIMGDALNKLGYDA